MDCGDNHSEMHEIILRICHVLNSMAVSPVADIHAIPENGHDEEE